MPVRPHPSSCGRIARALGVGLALVAAVAASASASAPPPADAIPAELWDRPRSGRALLAVPAVRRALDELASNPAARLTIRHAPGGESAAQAEEIRSWFIAHAIEDGRIALRADLAARDPVRLDVAPPSTR